MNSVYPSKLVGDFAWTQKRDAGPRSAVGNVSGNRCEPDCRSRGCEIYLGLVRYFREDWSWNNLQGHSPNHSRRVVVRYKRKYVHEELVNCLFKLAQEKKRLGDSWRSRHDLIAVYLGCIKQQNKQKKRDWLMDRQRDEIASKQYYMQSPNRSKLVKDYI